MDERNHKIKNGNKKQTMKDINWVKSYRRFLKTIHF